MQLMHPAEVPISNRDQVFSYSRAYALGSLLLTILGTGAVCYLAWRKQPVLTYYLAAVVLFFMIVFRKLITARFHLANWLVRLTENGIFIKFRSYLNNHFPEHEATVVFIPYSEIRSARYITEKQELPDRDGNRRPTPTTTKKRFVELELACDTKLFAEALRRERRYAIDGKALLKTITRYQHLPVRLPAADKLLIEWAGIPNATSLLDALIRHTLVLSTAEVSKDFVNLAGLSREEQESRLLELVESGDTVGAIAMARRLYACDLTQAKDLVEGLVNKR